MHAQCFLYSYDLIFSVGSFCTLSFKKINRVVVYMYAFMLLFIYTLQGPRNHSTIASDYYLSVSNLSVTNVNQVTFTCTKLWSPVAIYMYNNMLRVHIALFFHHGQYVLLRVLLKGIFVLEINCFAPLYSIMAVIYELFFLQ